MVALRARRSRDEETVGACLWYEHGDVAYYHLAAYAPAGYELRASYALFAGALELFAARGLAWASLGAGAGVDAGGGPEDGLSRFKRGWSTGTRVAWFGGRILRPDVYDRLAGPSRGRWFPAYREGEIG
jgi:lipid II:glycine glycyltransferase (peptidoglycan interpeptide bridge formation enzyme)